MRRGDDRLVIVRRVRDPVDESKIVVADVPVIAIVCYCDRLLTVAVTAQFTRMRKAAAGLRSTTAISRNSPMPLNAKAPERSKLTALGTTPGRCPTKRPVRSSPQNTHRTATTKVLRGLWRASSTIPLPAGSGRLRIRGFLLSVFCRSVSL